MARASDERPLKHTMTPQTQPVMTQDSTSSVYVPPRAGESVATIARIVATQAAVGLVTASIIALVAGAAAGFSALIGALVCLLPGLAFAAWIGAGLLATSGRAAPRIQLHTFYTGEVLKIAATVVLFTIVFTTVDGLDPVFLFTGFIVTQLTMIGVLLRG